MRARFDASFEVVLVDYDLDDGKGDDFVRWVRGAAASAVRIIAVSGRETGNAALLAAGADAACAKLAFARIGDFLHGG